MISKKHIAVLFSGIALFIISCTYLYSKYKDSAREEYIGYDESKHLGMDELDYHFLATNFALTNRFPVTGYILDTAVYGIKPDEEMNLIYLDMFKRNGPVTSFMRPPLIPLLIGCIYKILGYKYYYNLWLNILLLSLIIGLMPIVGSINWGLRGYFSGLIGALAFMHSVHESWFLNTMGIDIISSFIFFLVFAFGLYVERKGTLLSYLIWGGMIGLSLLAKPTILALLPIVYGLFIIIRHRHTSRIPAIKKLAVLFAGIVLIISPWSIYINHIQKITIAERESWCRRVLAGTENIELSNMQEVVEHPSGSFNDLDPRYERTIKWFKDIIVSLWTYHSRTTGFIVITNGFGDVLFNFNNEYCRDMYIHYEWKYLRSSFYRSRCSDSQSAVHKVLSFYYHNPSFIIKTPIGRFFYPFTSDYHRFFWLAASLWSLCVVQMQMYEIRNRGVKFLASVFLFLIIFLVFLFSFIFSKYSAIVLFIPLFFSGAFLFKMKYINIVSAIYPAIWFSLFMSIFFLVPNARYMAVAMPVSCLCVAYFSLTLINGFKDLAFGSSNDL